MSQLLQKLADGKSNAALTAADVTGDSLSEAKAAALKSSVLDRRILQDNIDAWVSSHADASHEATRTGLRSLRDAIDLNPFEHPVAEVQEIAANPKAYAAKTAENAKGLIKKELEYYNGSASRSEKVMQGIMTAMRILGLLWVAERVMDVGKKGGWFGKMLGRIGLVGASAWLINNGTRLDAPAKSATRTTPPASPPTKPQPAPPATPPSVPPSSEQPEDPGEEIFAVEKEMTIGGQTCSIVVEKGTGFLGADTKLLKIGTKIYDTETIFGVPPLSMLTSVHRKDGNLVLNKKYAVDEAAMGVILKNLATTSAAKTPVSVPYVKREEGKQPEPGQLDLVFVAKPENPA